jgi:hypothetical protein
MKSTRANGAVKRPVKAKSTLRAVCEERAEQQTADGRWTVRGHSRRERDNDRRELVG